MKKIALVCVLALMSLQGSFTNEISTKAKDLNQNTIQPSFDCTKAKSEVEKLICSDDSGDLQSLDQYLNTIYTQIKNELANSTLKDKHTALNELLKTQRKFINGTSKLSDKQDIQDAYEKRITKLLQSLGKILDSNNKELCEYAKISDKKQINWQEIKASTNFLFTTSLCAFGRNNENVLYETFCEQGRAKIKQIDLAIKEQSPYINTPQTFIQKIDINNDGKLDDIAYTQGSFFSIIWAFKDGKIDKKFSDMFYADDLHFSGAKSYEYICTNSEELCTALSTYKLPRHKISQVFTDKEGEIVPLFSFLRYGVFEFKGKNYISVYNARFKKDEKSEYPKNRIYLLEHNEIKLQCVF